ncbi:hypothetical protein [Paracoccus albus]|uniref:hypothetical protein n=1 Tax=Paracoccus albus TaxID=3017784 RepID=UPI0022F06E41|nr:hypothetical protein [Paracoccus albus]WBU60603.1 hypothetical protein PAF20_01365 [Paracoccus albus]
MTSSLRAIDLPVPKARQGRPTKRLARRSKAEDDARSVRESLDQIQHSQNFLGITVDPIGAIIIPVLHSIPNQSIDYVFPP